MIIDGRKLAQERKEEIKKERQKFGALSLGVVIATESAVTKSYVGIKKRAASDLDIEVKEYFLSESATQKEIESAVREANQHDGVILQLPLPQGIDVESAKNVIDVQKDVDVLSDAAFDAFSKNEFAAVPPVPAAMHYILKRNGVDPKGKSVAVLGRGRLVGRPAITLFERLGANVTAIDKGDSYDPLKTADIIISGTGVAGLIKPDMVKDGVVIIDGGTSESSGKVVGDADPECAEKASVFTPVPGGVGPIAVVEIFANLVALKTRRIDIFGK